MQTKWVEFVGGPLHGQCRNIPYDATHWNAYPAMSEHWDITNPGPVEQTVQLVTYKIERYWEGQPGSHRESFKGVLV